MLRHGSAHLFLVVPSVQDMQISAYEREANLNVVGAGAIVVHA